MGRGFGGWKIGGNFGWKMRLKKLKIDMEMNMKKDYEMPRVSLRRVELEQGFMAASKEEIKDTQVDVTIDKQTSDDGFTIEDWDK